MISSACPSPKAGGLLTTVASSLCQRDNISSSARIDGRILHVRIALEGSAVDAVNVYQKAHHTGHGRIEKGQNYQTPTEQRAKSGAPFAPFSESSLLGTTLFSPATSIRRLRWSEARPCGY